MFKSVDEFAAVRARLDAGQQLDAALADSDVGVRDWMHAQDEMLQAIGEAVDDGDRAHVVEHYRRAYEEAWKQLLGERRPLPITVKREADAFTPRPRREPQPQAPEEDAAAPLDETAAPDVAVLGRPVMPFTGEHAEPRPTAGTLAPATDLGETVCLDTGTFEALTSASLAETRGLDVALLTTAPVPFAGEAPPPATAPFERHPELGATAELDASGGLNASAVLDLNASAVLSAWTPDSYAVLVALTEFATGADRVKVHSELGIRNEEHRRQVDAQMRALFANDGDARAAYEDHLAILRGDGE